MMLCDKLKYENIGDMMPLYPRSTLVIRKQFVDAAIVELKAENRKLKRALWLASVELCHRLDVDRYLRKHRNSWYNENCLTWDEACVAMEVKMCKAESKCQAKAEEYK